MKTSQPDRVSVKNSTRRRKSDENFVRRDSILYNILSRHAEYTNVKLNKSSQTNIIDNILLNVTTRKHLARGESYACVAHATPTENSLIDTTRTVQTNEHSIEKKDAPGNQKAYYYYCCRNIVAMGVYYVSAFSVRIFSVCAPQLSVCILFATPPPPRN